MKNKIPEILNINHHSDPKSIFDWIVYLQFYFIEIRGPSKTLYTNRTISIIVTLTPWHIYHFHLCRVIIPATFKVTFWRRFRLWCGAFHPTLITRRIMRTNLEKFFLYYYYLLPIFSHIRILPPTRKLFMYIRN